MLVLKSFPPSLNLRCPSPFGLKAEALLAMSGLDYKVVGGDVRRAPKGKLPVLIDGDRQIADSSLIKAYLEDVHGVDFDGSLSREQLAVGKAVQRMVENHLYFAGIHFRWVENPDIVREAFFKKIPALIRKFIFAMILKKVKRDNLGHGMGRHAPNEILAFAIEDFTALSVLLGDKKYMFGDKPTSIDATVYGAMEGAINVSIPSQYREAAREFTNLVDYCDRFGREVFES